MKKIVNKVKGFTLTELAIVIAVIAVLVAVLVPTFISLINRANNSSDEQTITYLNTALSVDEAENGTPETLCEVWDVLEDAGYTSAPSPIYSGNTFYWYKDDNRIVIVNDNTITFPAEYEGITVVEDNTSATGSNVALCSVTVAEEKVASLSLADDLLALSTSKDDPSAHLTSFENSGYCSDCGYASYSYMLNKDIIAVDSSDSTKLTAVSSSIESIVIPEGITDIGKVFMNNTTVTSITLPSTLTSLENQAFSGCTSLKSFTLSSSITSLDLDGTMLFYNCTSLEEVNIECEITTIGTAMFRGCSALTSITIPDSVTTIGSNAFYGCTSLADITIGTGVTKLSASTASNPYTQGIFYNTAYYNDESNWENGLLYIGSYLVAADSNLSGSVEIKEGTTLVAEAAFYGNTNILSVTIPSTLTSIGDYAFQNCSKLKVVVNLSTLSIRANATTYGYVAYNAYNVYKVADSDVLVTQDDYIFCKDSSGGYSLLVYSGDDATITLPQLTINGTVTSYTIGDYAFYNNTDITSITIPDSVTSIGGYAFYKCTALTSVTIGSNVESINEYSFYNCSKLTSITIPDSVTSIGNSAFYGCTGLTSITIPDNVTTIGNYAFYNCTSAGSLTIGKGVTSVGGSAFRSCMALTEINFNATAMNDLTDNNYVFMIAGQSGTGITVTIGADVTSIPARLFYPSAVSQYSTSSSPYIVSIKFAENSVCTSVGSNAFMNCSQLAGVYITDIAVWCGISFANVQANPLNYVKRLSLNNILVTNVTIPASVTSIGNYAFYAYTPLTSVIFDENSSLTSIGNYAFYSCSSLTSITIPANVTSIGKYAFRSSGLTSVTFEKTTGWYVTKTENATSGTSVTNPTYTNLKKNNYGEYYWYRSEN